MSEETRRERPWRALIIGTLLIPPSQLFGVYTYIVAQATLWGQTSLLRGPVFVLFSMVLLNLFLRRLKKSLALTETELLIIYIMAAISTAASGIGMAQFVVPALGAPVYYATPENKWEEFLPFVPKWLHPRNRSTIDALYYGGTSLYQLKFIKDLARPVLLWSGIMFLLVFVMLCLSVLFRPQWVDREKLTFPLVYLPLEMAREGGGAFWQSRLMWSGFALAGLAESVNSVNFLYPAFPYIQIKPFNLGQFIVQHPWSALNPFFIAFYPFMLGIGFILPLDVSAGCWGFYILRKLLDVVCVGLGWRDPGVSPAVARAPYVAEQGAGAFLGLALLLLWRSRADIWRPLRGIFSASRSQQAGPAEVLSPKAALLGIFLGISLLVVFFSYAGLSPHLALAFFAFYFLFTIVIARIVAEAGAGWTMAPALIPHRLIFAFTGTEALSVKDLTVLAHLNILDSDFRDSNMPHQMIGLRLVSTYDKATARTLRFALLVSAGFGIFVAMWAHLHVYFIYGLTSAKVRLWPTQMGQSPFRNLRSWLDVPLTADPTGLKAVVAGFGLVCLLVHLRERFIWWPLHPIGYVLATTGSMDYVWCPFFVSWLVKLLVLRYGGMRYYRKALPLFLGLMLGDYIVPLLWAFYGTATGQQMYMSFPH